MNHVLKCINEGRLDTNDIGLFASFSKKIMTKAILFNPQTFMCARKFLRNNKQIAMLAIEQDGNMIEYASPRLKRDRDIIKAAVKNNPRVLTKLSKEYCDDEEIVSLGLDNYYSSYKYASERLKSKKELALKAFKADGLLIKYAPENIKNDKELVLVAVNNNYRALVYIPIHFFKDRDVALSAIKTETYEEVDFDLFDINTEGCDFRITRAYGYALKYLHYFLNDKEIVLEAVENGEVLKILKSHKSKLLYDRDVLKKAVSTSYRAIQYVPTEIRNNLKFAKFAIDKYKYTNENKIFNPVVYHYVMNKRVEDMVKKKGLKKEDNFEL